MAALFYLPFRPALDANALAVPGAKLFFYQPGTTTKRPVYTSAALTTELPNPVEANAAGVWPAIYLDDALTYRVVLKDANDDDLNDVDPYVPGVTGEKGDKGDPGGNVMSIGLFADLDELDNIPAGTDTIRTSGYTLLGKGAANYVRWSAPLGALPAWGQGVWWQQAADGSRWFLSKDQTITSDMFGTLGDGAMAYLSTTATGTDVSVNLNNMRRWGLSTWGVARGVLTQGGHRVEDTVHLSLGEGFTAAYTLEGETRNAWGLWDGAAIPASRIITSRNDRPIFSVQGARGGAVRWIAFYGPLVAHIAPQYLGRAVAPIPTIDDRQQSAWLPGSGPHSNGRYNPGCAIAIDPYSGVRPAQSYPNAPYRADAGESTVQYGRTHTSVFEIRGCVFGGFSVAVAIKPSDSDANADYITMPDCTADYCIIVCSGGGSQLRNNDTSNLKYAFVHTVLSGSTHGRQIGAMAGTHRNWCGGHQIQLVEYNAGFTGPLTLEGVYFEGGHRLATITGSGPPFRMTSAKILYIGGPDSASLSPIRGVAFNHIGVSPTSSATVGCAVEIDGEIAKPAPLVINATRVRMNVTVVDNSFPSGLPCPQYRAVALNATCNGLLVPRRNSASTGQPDIKAVFNRYNAGSTPNASVLGSRYFDGVTAELPTRSEPAPIWATAYRGQNMGFSIPMPFHGVALGGSMTSVTLTGRVLRGTWAGFWNAGHPQRWAMLPGDMWQHSSGYWAVVTSYDSATDQITLLIENGWANNGGTITWETGSAASVLADLSSGTWFTHGSRRFGPSSHLVADFTSGSINITNIGTNNGTAASSGLTEAAVGDFVYFREELDGPIFNHRSQLVTITSGTPGSLAGTAGLPGSLTVTRKPLLFGSYIAPNVPNP